MERKRYGVRNSVIERLFFFFFRRITIIIDVNFKSRSYWDGEIKKSSPKDQHSSRWRKSRRYSNIKFENLRQLGEIRVTCTVPVVETVRCRATRKNWVDWNYYFVTPLQISRYGAYLVNFNNLFIVVRFCE